MFKFFFHSDTRIKKIYFIINKKNIGNNINNFEIYSLLILHSELFRIAIRKKMEMEVKFIFYFILKKKCILTFYIDKKNREII